MSPYEKPFGKRRGTEATFKTAGLQYNTFNTSDSRSAFLMDTTTTFKNQALTLQS